MYGKSNCGAYLKNKKGFMSLLRCGENSAVSTMSRPPTGRAPPGFKAILCVDRVQPFKVRTNRSERIRKTLFAGGFTS